MQIDIAINILCMDIAHLEGGRSQGKVLVCSRALQSVNSDRVVHKQSTAQTKWKATHFLLNSYLDFDLVGKL